MTYSLTKSALFMGVAVLMAVAAHSPAMADPGGKHKHKGSHHEQRGPIIIESRDRVIIRNYIVQNYRAHCPPGLAKKHNGCMPPGHAKKYYIGQVLPPGIYVPVSGELLTMLSPVPYGYQYVQVDKDVLLISEASKKVIDAVTLLSAVGN